MVSKQGMWQRVKQVRPLLAALVMCFAFSSWIDLMGVWVEFPILVHTLPEGWNLPSYVVILIQCAIITPTAYTLINKFCPGNVQQREVVMAYFIMGIGVTALLLLSIFWKHTVYFAGAERSLPLLLLVFLLAMVDMTSCIVYLPFMVRFKEHYIPAYVAGEELGGLITGMIGLVQGSGGEAFCTNSTIVIFNETLGVNITETTLESTRSEPRFSASVFFVFLMCLMGLSLISFSILNFSSYAKKEMVSEQTSSKGMAGKPEKIDPESKDSLLTANECLKVSSINDDKKIDEDTEETQQDPPSLPHWKLCILCSLLIWNSLAVYGIFPSVQSFSCLPYSPITYTLAVRLPCIANPLAALSTIILQMKKLWSFIALTCLSTLLVLYHITLASMSPEPVLKDTFMGSFLVIISSVGLSASFAFNRASIVAVLRTDGGHQALLFGGYSIQFGAFFGGITGFLMVNVFHLFESGPVCSNM